ncbi:hypothetical protein [Acinetobacter towneri]|uniref:hypothetical protein n=1 Tax=Acinetobacter towneri TaxID=202956 RepID=UPI0034D4B1C0
MNLIEQLGGYEKAEDGLRRLELDKKDLLTCGGLVVVKSELDAALLEYRRQHNIFEVGDLVIDTNYKDSDIQEIKSVNGNRIEVFHKNKSYYFATFIFSFRHATDAEIKAGKRLEVNQ